MTTKQPVHKPVIETIINTAAIAISGMGVINLQQGKYIGFAFIVFAAALEFFKYCGRKQDYW